jgi:predicted translin family RNA/ssDNA-binding protein
LNIIDDDGFDIVTNVDNINLIERLPKTIKVSIHSNIDIINKINQTLNSIQDKIQKYNAAYFSYFYRLNIHDDVENIILYCDIFDKRLSMLLDILKLYYK